MAKFEVMLPTEIEKEFKKIYQNTEKIFGAMTRAGAEVALQDAKAHAPDTIASYGRLTNTYRTPSDGGINTKVTFSGYVPFSGNRKEFKRRGKSGGKVYSSTKGVPVDFLAILYEYGRSTAPFPKRPFLRKAFGSGQIEKAMLAAQKRESGGLLE